eukprot:m.54174 g.54174  ORF g.54174 m.54174 type:complete len:801 (+) comp10908_c0_seq2:375-2777(+)
MMYAHNKRPRHLLCTSAFVLLLFVLFSHAEDLKTCEVTCSVPSMCMCDDFDDNCKCTLLGKRVAKRRSKSSKSTKKSDDDDDKDPEITVTETSTTATATTISTTTISTSSSSSTSTSTSSSFTTTEVIPSTSTRKGDNDKEYNDTEFSLTMTATMTTTKVTTTKITTTTKKLTTAQVDLMTTDNIQLGVIRPITTTAINPAPYSVILLFIIPPSSNCELSSVADFKNAVVQDVNTPITSADGSCQEDIISTVNITLSFESEESAKEAYAELSSIIAFAVKGEEYKPQMTPVGFEPKDKRNPRKDDINTDAAIIVVAVLVVVFAVVGGVYANGSVVGSSSSLIITNIQIRITTGESIKDYDLDTVILRKPSNGRDSWVIWTPDGVVKPSRVQFVVHFDDKSAMNLASVKDDFEFSLHKVIPRNRKNLLYDNLEESMCNVKWACVNENPNIVDFPPTMRVTFTSAKARSESHISDFKEKVHRIRIKMQPGLSCQSTYEFDVFAGKKKVDFFNVKSSPNNTRKVDNTRKTANTSKSENKNKVSAERLSAIQPPAFFSKLQKPSPQQKKFVPYKPDTIAKVNPLFSLGESKAGEPWQQEQCEPHQQQQQQQQQHRQTQSNNGPVYDLAQNTFSASSPDSLSSLSSLSEYADSPFYQAFDDSINSPPSTAHNSPVIHNGRVILTDVSDYENNPMFTSSPPGAPSSVGSPQMHASSPMLGSPFEYDTDSADLNLILDTQQQPADNDETMMAFMNDGPEIIDEIVTLMETGHASTPDISIVPGVTKRPSRFSQDSDTFLEWLSNDLN